MEVLQAAGETACEPGVGRAEEMARFLDEGDAQHEELVLDALHLDQLCSEP